MNSHLIHIVYEAGTSIHGQPMPREEEIVLVNAPTLQNARDTAMYHNEIAAKGRMVRMYDENGVELYGTPR
jgi:hypothetical protein